MADEYKINTRDVDDTSELPSGAYFIPTDDIGSGGGGGGSEVFTVTFAEKNSEWTADKTLAEILEAAQAGIVVGIREADHDGVEYFPLIEYQTATGYEKAVFLKIGLYEDDVAYTTNLLAERFTVNAYGVYYKDATVTIE